VCVIWGGMILGSANNYQIINIFIFKDLVSTHVHEFLQV
jgi:hypothetical protein